MIKTQEEQGGRECNRWLEKEDGKCKGSRTLGVQGRNALGTYGQSTLHRTRGRALFLWHMWHCLVPQPVPAGTHGTVLSWLTHMALSYPLACPYWDTQDCPLSMLAHTGLSPGPADTHSTVLWPCWHTQDCPLPYWLTWHCPLSMVTHVALSPVPAGTHGTVPCPRWHMWPCCLSTVPDSGPAQAHTVTMLWPAHQTHLMNSQVGWRQG